MEEPARWTRSVAAMASQALTERGHAGVQLHARVTPTRFSAGVNPATAADSATTRAASSLAARVTRADSGGMPPAAAPSRSWGEGASVSLCGVQQSL